MSGQPGVSAATELSEGSSAGRKGVLVRVSFAVIEHHDNKQLRRKGFISAYNSQVTLH